MKPKPPCGWLVGSDDDEKKCGKESVDEITVKGRIGGGKIPVCHEHKITFNHRAAALRTSLKK